MQRIGTNEHVFVAGQTGTGKSFLTEVYLSGFQFVVKIDTKGEYYERVRSGEEVWRGLEQDKDYTVIFKLADLDQVETKKIIWVPDWNEQTQEHYNACLMWCYNR